MELRKNLFNFTGKESPCKEKEIMMRDGTILHNPVMKEVDINGTNYWIMTGDGDKKETE